jgi:hypothetical protein
MSDPKLVRIREKLDDLLAVINDKSDAFKEQVRFAYGEEEIEETWGGAKMVVTSAPVKPPPEDADGITWSRFESITWVSTPHAKSLGWVIKQIRDIFGDTLSAFNKYDFYGSLGAAAIAYQDLNEDYETEIGIATAVIEQAYKVLELWEDNIENRPFYYKA